MRERERRARARGCVLRPSTGDQEPQQQGIGSERRRATLGSRATESLLSADKSAHCPALRGVGVNQVRAIIEAALNGCEPMRKTVEHVAVLEEVVVEALAMM